MYGIDGRQKSWKSQAGPTLTANAVATKSTAQQTAKQKNESLRKLSGRRYLGAETFQFLLEHTGQDRT
jgi:hypothetical protein